MQDQKEAIGYIRKNFEFRDPKTGRYLQNPAIGTLERYGSINILTLYVSKEAYLSKLAKERYEIMKEASEASNINDEASIL